MRNLYRIIQATILIVLFGTTFATAQTTTKTAKELVQEGIKLHDEQKYDEAIAKYKEALKVEPDNLQADYELAYTLYSSDKMAEAIPYLETIIKSPGASKYESYEMLGNIYDIQGKQDEAIKAYNLGIAEKPDYARLRYNLGIVYMGLKKYTEAEDCAIKGITLDAKHPGCQWLYATINAEQNKKMKAILGFSSYLLLEPSGNRAEKAFVRLQDLLTFGVTKKDEKNINISLPASTLDAKDESSLSNMALQLSAANVIGKNLAPVEQLQELLKSAFELASEKQADPRDKGFFKNGYINYFAALAKTTNMPAFARYVSFSAYKDENLKWFDDHKDALPAFQTWFNTNSRQF